ncbi:MAG: hypothetical protein NC432_12940 [Roseburia sp.]|nr:hypothetical protein [Roseburia sp.]MCM1098800.1 hypothetical protein [Ruminococcus flavefaciens]
MIKLKEIIDYLILRSHAKSKDDFEYFTNGMCYRYVAPSYAMLYGSEAVWREKERQEDELTKIMEKINKESAADSWEHILKKRQERVEQKRQEKLLRAEYGQTGE